MLLLKKFFILLLVLAWVPMTAHCSIESIPGLEFLACKGETSNSTDHCKDTGCCSFESSALKTENAKVFCPVVVFIAVYSQLAFLNVEPPKEKVIRVLAIPPELPQSWQFISRAALPVRAPSIAS